MSNKKYNNEFKSEAVNLALSSELSYAQLARDLGVNPKTFGNWIRQTMKNSNPPSSPHKTASKADYQALERQNKALQKELSLRKQEIEFLKKASAYFAKLK